MMGRVAIVLVVGALVLMGMWFLTVGSVLGHDRGAGSWIHRNQLKDPLSKHYCCNQQDCEAVAPGGIKEEGGGFHILQTGEVWPYARVLWESQDGQWWRCSYMMNSPFPGMISRKLNTRCLIGPPQSF